MAEYSEYFKVGDRVTIEGFLDGRVLVVQQDKDGNLVFVPEKYATA